MGNGEDNEFDGEYVIEISLIHYKKINNLGKDFNESLEKIILHYLDNV